jgi:hypothetical protein
MSTKAFGDKLFNKVLSTKAFLFIQGELFQLTNQAFEKYIKYIQDSTGTKIPMTYPIGIKENNTPILSTYEYTKKELFQRCDYLMMNQLPVNGIYQFVTLVESLLVDILRDVLIEFPNKIPNKKKFDYESVLNATSLQEVKLGLINIVINEMTYKSPRDFAEDFKNYVGVDLLKKPVFLDYIELKATRDIHIHNQGIANEIYLSKAGSKARVKSGQELPVDIIYFLKSYEWCIQMTNILESELHEIWPSSDYIERKKLISDKTKSREQKIKEAETITRRKK